MHATSIINHAHEHPDQNLVAYAPALQRRLMYPYELGKKLNHHRNSIGQRGEAVQRKPEVIAYVRSMYTEDRIPDWVGVIEGDVNYREFLQSRCNITSHG